MTVLGVALLLTQLASYTEITCSINVTEYIPSSDSKYRVILQVSTINKEQKVIYPNEVSYNYLPEVIKCYLYSCKGNNCPLVTVELLDAQSILGIVLLSVFGLLLLIIPCVVFLEKETPRRTNSENDAPGRENNPVTQTEESPIGRTESFPSTIHISSYGTSTTVVRE